MSYELLMHVVLFIKTYELPTLMNSNIIHYYLYIYIYEVQDRTGYKRLMCFSITSQKCVT